MPILKRELDIYPQELFDLSIEENPWWIVYVRSRQEKLLSRHLVERQLPFYFPQTERRTKRGGRNFVSFHPLFPGYVFLRVPKPLRADVFRSDVIVNTIDVIDQPLLNLELRQLFDLQQRGATLVVHPEIAPGDPVRITEGIFAGYRGTVMREKGETRLLISITTLQQSVAVELGRDSVAPVERRSALYA